jgi:peptide/nickel transport system ATP-binding protein
MSDTRDPVVGGLVVGGLVIRSYGGGALVDDLEFSLAPGERLGLIGESGSGKSLTALAIMGLLPDGLVPSGSITLSGAEVIGRAERSLVRLRGREATVVFQEPLTALDPLMRLGNQVAEPLRRVAADRGEKLDRVVLRRQVIEALDEVALPEPQRIAGSYPHQVSGGQRQRVAIAIALACLPKLLIADEPTTALDVSVQAGILELLDRVVTERRMSLLFISHDLAVVSAVTDRVLVLEHGRAVERGVLAELIRDSQHPYTRELVQGARSLDDALDHPGRLT